MELRSKSPWTVDEDREIEMLALSFRHLWFRAMEKDAKCTPGHYPPSFWWDLVMKIKEEEKS
jgi:hypothetical protein